MYIMIGSSKYTCRKSHLESLTIWHDVKGLTLPIPADCVIRTYYDDGTLYTEDHVRESDKVTYKNGMLTVTRVHASLPAVDTTGAKRKEVRSIDLESDS